MPSNVSSAEGHAGEMILDYAESAEHILARPLGRLIFSARKVRVVVASSRLARQEANIFARTIFSIEGISSCEENTEEFYRQRREEHYREGVDQLIHATLERSLGSDSFLAELAPLTDD
jgi:hypothetical protein